MDRKHCPTSFPVLDKVSPSFSCCFLVFHYGHTRLMCLTVRLSYLIQITIVGSDGKEEYSPVSLFEGSLAVIEI